MILGMNFIRSNLTDILGDEVRYGFNAAIGFVFEQDLRSDVHVVLGIWSELIQREIEEGRTLVEEVCFTFALRNRGHSRKSFFHDKLRNFSLCYPLAVPRKIFPLAIGLFRAPDNEVSVDWSGHGQGFFNRNNRGGGGCIGSNIARLVRICNQ